MEGDLLDKPSMLKSVIREAFPKFYDGLLAQLLSTPGDFWINQWLYENYPSFWDEIEKGLDEIFAVTHQSLGKRIRDFTPRTVYRASNSMNAAFAGFVAELLSKEEFVRPYWKTEFERLGAKLRSYNLTDRGQLGDKETTDNWAKELGVVGWYGWKGLYGKLSGPK